MKNLKDRVVLDPKILMGKPTINGTRISVKLILDLIAEGYSFDKIIEEYPSLSREDIIAAISFASTIVDFNASSSRS